MDKCVEVIDTLILPYISYGLIAWGNAYNAYLNKILVLQKRVLRLIYFADRREDAIPLFVKTKILPVTFLYYEVVSKLMFDLHNQSAPINIVKLFIIKHHTFMPTILDHPSCSSLVQNTLDLTYKKGLFRVLVSKFGIRY